MLQFLTPSVWAEITSEAAGSTHPARVAVAYFGMDGPRLLPLPPKSRLVVDASIATVSAGSTHPASLERLRAIGVEIYSAQNLHAKAYAFDKVGFVGSPNASHKSSSMLIEAVLKTTSKASLISIREFVDSLALTRLSKLDLADLGKYYKPPKKSAVARAQAKFSTLVMELTNEQGGTRASQVQPPRAVWEHYFGIDVASVYPLPGLQLANLRGVHLGSVNRPVIRHHHVYTIEISGAELPRPAILQLRKKAPLEFEYAVFRPSDPEFFKLRELLQNVDNPLRVNGRKWLMV